MTPARRIHDAACCFRENAIAITGPVERLLVAWGSVLAAAAVALAAYASHAAAPGVRAQLLIAAAAAFGHGLALAALAQRPRRPVALFALAGLGLGATLFAGALVASSLAMVPARAAPFGGGLLIAAWLLHAIDACRRR